MMREKAHIQYLDVLKGVIIFLVVVGHAFHFGFEYYRSTLLYVLRSIDMPIFLFLSGFLGASNLSFDLKSIGAYWLKKARQLLLPLCTLPVLYALFFDIEWGHLLLDRMHGGYWFTLSLFEMFVLLYGLRYVDSLANRKGCLWIELLLAGASLAFVLLIDTPWHNAHPMSWEALSWGKTNYLYYYFLFGYFVGKYERLELMITSAPMQLVASALFVACIYYEVTYHRVLEGIPASLSGVVMAYSTAKKLGNNPTRLNRLCMLLGRESRTIYLTHYFLLFSAPMVGAFLKGFKDDARIFLWESLAACIYATIVIAATLLVVRLLKSSAYLNTLFYGKKLPSELFPMSILRKKTSE